ncbi:hypothetical protein [Streptomyces griseorubiginosus]|uniref:hypothetical protein n=1 Tax=Streptomyces griseorubiginosus TaxID=67304 RepID=UPI002E81E6D9|nr:hypothetical protein [Streptomyces griseorubiginosus]WUB48479.1 hypothetical protein OHN19_36120 [Streptomyces griseorubiginosus]WUB57005.1 hypothetical protein OG942_36130 [Streptomyces griseorubiginosus]
MSTSARRPAAADRVAARSLRIADESAFTKAVDGSRTVAALYFYLELDVLVGCARLVAADFFARPHLYTSLGDGRLAARIAEFHARHGHDERIPDAAQRAEVYRAVFGAFAESRTGCSPHRYARAGSDFPKLTEEFVAACTAFAERVFDTGEAMLRERVRIAHRPLRGYLAGIAGDALTWCTEEAAASVARDRAYPILRDSGIAAVFGIPTAPRGDWPYAADPTADKLVEEISHRLAPGPHLGEGVPALTREGASRRQRAAVRGTEALVAVLDTPDDASPEQLDELITRGYTWGSALAELGPAVHRAALPALPSQISEA